MGAETAPAEQFGPYVVYERLGVGGMATVHRALEHGVAGFERVVALKRLLPHLAEDASFIKSFVREAKLASLLSHVNIVQIFDLGRVGTEYFITMEYIDGRDVREMLRHARKVTGPPPMNVTVGLMLQLCEALDYAHGKVDEAGRPLGLVHRDVSPSNLLVTSAGHLKVIDFGIAKARSSIVKTVGVLKGKFAYMSPEQTMGKSIDRRSDIFSMGIVLYEMVTGERLFSGDSDFAVLERVRTVDIRPARDIVPTLPEALEQVITRALTADRDARYQWCDEMRDAIAGIGAASRVELGTWLRELFANEIAKEREDLGLSTRAVRRSEPMAAVAEPAPASAPVPRPTPRPAKPADTERIEMLDLEDEQTSIRKFPTASDVAAGDDEPLELLELPPQQVDLPPWLRKR
jgi:serine/threonine protein kinase